ncbi:SU10 major capsid protein [Streptomyces cylindrosporus]|uniref:DUF5309 domain-containing protein n=1 Tax=Streptomyces cylindrosporus TaxID=2927583 RepID=A0ABS9Y2G2_9ACTN|nr:DUF5309 family protein [Streptomyces cylindrosporus]MCI3271399.1 DUF5309 domain-containing protein [Streptomyces cylindrosporus]
MAGITGMGTTFNLPNYAGELFAITPDDTPLLSAIGGLTGGGQTTSTEFEWSTYDLRDPAQRTKTEGATAPTAEERVRGNVRNVCQIHQEKVSVSYTKQAAVGQMATPQSAPFNSVNGSNAVTNELDWQTAQALKSVALDVNWSFINGSYVNPTTNATARQTRGLLQAITTNRIARGTSVSGATSATDTITATAHGLSVGNKIVFTAIGAMAGVVPGRIYYVVTVTDANNFKISSTSGGAAITVGTATGIAFTKPWATALTTDHVNDMLQLAYDNGGISEQETATLLSNSVQKRAITKAFASAYGQYRETSRNVGGVNMTTIVTDFGTLNLMMDRHMPQDTIAAVSLEQLMPVFLNIPGKGVFFDEPLAKTGASDERQLYGEIGLKYGLERAHAVQTGLVI